MAKTRLHASLTLCNGETGDTESFFLDTVEGDTKYELYDGLSPILRKFAQDWDDFIEEQTGVRPGAKSPA